MKMLSEVGKNSNQTMQKYRQQTHNSILLDLNVRDKYMSTKVKFLDIHLYVNIKYFLKFTFCIPLYTRPEPIADRAVPASPYVIHLYLEKQEVMRTDKARFQIKFQNYLNIKENSLSNCSINPNSCSQILVISESFNCMPKIHKLENTIQLNLQLIETAKVTNRKQISRNEQVNKTYFAKQIEDAHTKLSCSVPISG